MRDMELLYGLVTQLNRPIAEKLTKGRSSAPLITKLPARLGN